ncbi:hypothetical protein BDN70DRAFT_871468 [Pholiota conissans]|uniref:Uncharacterized protein n=1 Tax=Pholiota conissans TaxID=109636 RepID=A0A9P5ZGE1_9AGAR|nr:hypothetical protein BDN70DRAFT_871468 [Pholiota conissans]
MSMNTTPYDGVARLSLVILSPCFYTVISPATTSSPYPFRARPSYLDTCLRIARLSPFPTSSVNSWPAIHTV